MDLHFLFGQLPQGPVCSAARVVRGQYFQAVSLAFRRHRLERVYYALPTLPPRHQAAILIGSPAFLPASLRWVMPPDFSGFLPDLLRSELASAWISTLGAWSQSQS